MVQRISWNNPFKWKGGTSGTRNPWTKKQETPYNQHSWNTSNSLQRRVHYPPRPSPFPTSPSKWHDVLVLYRGSGWINRSTWSHCYQCMYISTLTLTLLTPGHWRHHQNIRYNPRPKSDSLKSTCQRCRGCSGNEWVVCTPNPLLPHTKLIQRYHTWSDSGASFHYVTRTPSQLFPVLSNFLKSHFPLGSVHLNIVRLRDTVGRMFAGKAVRVRGKEEEILGILKVRYSSITFFSKRTI